MRNSLPGAISGVLVLAIAGQFASAQEPTADQAAVVEVDTEQALTPTEAPTEDSSGTAVEWRTDYASAYTEAKENQRMLLVNFVSDGAEPTQQRLMEYINSNPEMREDIRDVVPVRVDTETEITVNGEPIRLLSHGAFRHLNGRAGIAIIDLAHEDAPYYGDVVTALPYSSGKYYRWREKNLDVALDLPAGTITQRTMVWAVRMHPEAPASTTGESSEQLASAAAEHSQYQANIGVQGHQRWGSRFNLVRRLVGAGSAQEVVAESWPGQDLIDSCIDCVDSWRHSSGHWGAVRRPQRMFGYDIRRGRNGIWYGTGIFAN